MGSSATLDFALDLILKHEGGFVDDPNDPGGATNYGISNRAHPVDRDGDGDVDADDARLVSPEEARAIYTNKYYLAAHCERLPVGLDVCVFDMAVNAGVEAAVKLLQRMVGSGADGIIGPQTLAAVRAYDGDFIAGYTVARINYYRKLPGWKHYGGGWAYRAAVTGAEASRLRKRIGIA